MEVSSFVLLACVSLSILETWLSGNVVASGVEVGVGCGLFVGSVVGSTVAVGFGVSVGVGVGVAVGFGVTVGVGVGVAVGFGAFLYTTITGEKLSNVQSNPFFCTVNGNSSMVPAWEPTPCICRTLKV